MNDTFNINLWEEDCRKYDRNREGLKFQGFCSIIDGKMVLKINNIEEQYRPLIEERMLANARGAVAVMYDFISAKYVLKEEDYEVENKQCNAIISANMETWMNILFERGVDAFLEVLSSQYMILRTKYLLDNITNKNGVWTLSNGTIWNGTNWITKEGKEYYDAINLWNYILGNQSHDTPNSSKTIQAA